jgi:hypothetical protein
MPSRLFCARTLGDDQLVLFGALDELPRTRGLPDETHMNAAKVLVRGKQRPLLQIVGGVWWCTACDASGRLPARTKHAKFCAGARRPLTWSPPPILQA